RLVKWFERIAAFGHGTSQEITSEEAFDIAKQAEPIEPMYIENKSKNVWHLGQRLQVIPDDMGKVPVEGTFIAADDYEIILRRSNGKLGDVNVHFPRAGFDVIPLE
ncbi:unnamed protein product, partial [Rotaria sordida]